MRKGTAEMVGDTLRRAGLLIVVFGAIVFFPGRPGNWLPWLVVGVVLWVAGVVVERRRVT